MGKGQKMDSLSVRELQKAVGGELLGGFADLDRKVSAVTTDSRKVPEGALFVPLAGERADGHDYLEAAMDGGAAGALVSRAPDAFQKGHFYIRVVDTRAALGKLAAYYRSRFDLPVAGVTGSVGKTTTKDMIASVLSERFHVCKTEGNFNNDLGVPLTLLRLSREDEAAVVEMGMNHAGEIRNLARMVRPTLGAITNIGDAHIEFLGSRENILRAKCEMFEFLAPEGAALLNGDDPLLRTLKGRLNRKVVWCGTAEDADVRVSEIESRGTEEISCRVDSPFYSGSLTIPAPGRHMIYSAAMAVAAGGLLGLSGEELRRGVAAFRPTGMRMNVLKLTGRVTVLDDCYNANPQSMAAAVEVLSRSERAHKIAVLGDMGELGELGPQAHYELGRKLGEAGIETAVAVGGLARHIRDGARDAGVPRVLYFETKEEAHPALAELLSDDCAILVKASHSMHFEELVSFLKEAAMQ